MVLTLVLLCGFFVGAILFQGVTKIRVCAVCVAASLTWLVLLLLYWIKGSINPLIPAILMGGSGVGLMYYLGKKLPEKYSLLKFPFLVTAFWIAFRLIFATTTGLREEALFLGGMWAVFGAIFLLYQSNRLREIAKHLIECCKNW